VGAAERLDFTITGPAVNLVSRIENLCRDLHYPLLTSAQFASPCGSTLRSIGCTGCAAWRRCRRSTRCRERRNVSSMP
jgi:class 3 adenylate cyclase